MRVDGVGRYALMGETVDDAAGEAFDKTAQALGLGYPGGPALAALAASGVAGRYALPRPKMTSDDLEFSFSGLKTAVVTALRKHAPDDKGRADIAAEFQQAVVDVLVSKSLRAVEAAGCDRLVVAGGVGANRRLREALGAAAATRGVAVHFPEQVFCTDNGAMIALAGALRLQSTSPAGAFGVRPRWDLASLATP
jgi:N6-L-threonylcarbamoyladenine synthase